MEAQNRLLRSAAPALMADLRSVMRIEVESDTGDAEL